MIPEYTNIRKIFTNVNSFQCRLAIFELALFKHCLIIFSVISHTPILLQERQNNMLENSMDSTVTEN